MPVDNCCANATQMTFSETGVFVSKYMRDKAQLQRQSEDHTESKDKENLLKHSLVM